MNFSFDGTIKKEVLENYLSRSVTAAGLYESETLEDDLRVIAKLGVKFLGRASGIWYMPKDDELHFAKSKELADRVHAQDPEIILQSCVFEIITEGIENIQIPDYVFRVFGLIPEQRCFRLEDALFPERPDGFIHKSEEKSKNGGIPDLNRIEARMWFYYRATCYIDCGYEALHMGQVHLYTANDKGLKKTWELFEMIREYAKEHARRHKILLDAHTHGVNVNGKLLFDYHAMPFTRAVFLEKDGEELVLVREGYSEGGLNPNGWSSDVMPYLMEYDNWGGLCVDDRSKYSREELAQKDWWGYDQIAWFANQNAVARNHFLEYTYYWTEINNVNAYFQFPFRRMLSDASVKMTRSDNQEQALQTFYQVNNPSDACTMGFGQEDVVKQLWEKGHRLREKAGNPPSLIRFGAEMEFDPATGMKLPENVVVYGSFQPSVGAIKNDSNSAVTRMYYIGDNKYTLSFIIPYAGEYDFGVSTYGTLSAIYCSDRFPRSGSGAKGYFSVKKDNTVVKVTFCYSESLVTVEVFDPDEI